MKNMMLSMLVSCGVTVAGTALAADKLSFTLNYSADPGHATFLYTQKLGYYKEAGLDVQINQGRGSTSTAQLVASGQTDVGLADASAAINVAARGAPIKIIGVVEQVSGFAVIVKTDSPIKSPKDLEGRKIGIVAGTLDRALLQAIANASGIDLQKMEIINFDSAAKIPMLAEGRVDAFIDVPDIMTPRLKERGIETRPMYVKDYGVKLFSQSIITTASMISEKPDVLRRFVEATLKGLKATTANPKAAVDALLEAYPDAGKPDAALFTVQERSRKNYCVSESVGYGQPSEALLDASYEVMTKYLGVSASQPLTALYDPSLLPNPPVKCSVQ